MLTTAGLAASATSAKLVGNGADSATAGAAPTAAAESTGRLTAAAGADRAGAGDSDPATMAPTRKPTVAVSPAVNQAKRRVMASL